MFTGKQVSVSSEVADNLTISPPFNAPANPVCLPRADRRLSVQRGQSHLGSPSIAMDGQSLGFCPEQRPIVDHLEPVRSVSGAQLSGNKVLQLSVDHPRMP